MNKILIGKLINHMCEYIAMCGDAGYTSEDLDGIEADLIELEKLEDSLND